MRQRTALARSLAQKADILLMDEPFGALDAMTRDLLDDELEALWTRTGLTVLFVTHNVREAVRLGDRVVLLTSRPGRIAQEYTVDSGRPRRIDSTQVAELAASITDRLRKRCAVMATLEAELAGLDALELYVPAAPQPGVADLGCDVAQARRDRGSRSCSGSSSSGAVGRRTSSCRARFRSSEPCSRTSATTSRPRASPSNGRSSASQSRPVIGTFIGALVTKSRILRSAVGSMVTGLMTMPSIAWFPAAIVLFGLKRQRDPVRHRDRRGAVDRQRIHRRR